MVAIRCGDIVAHGTPEEVMTAEVLREAFRIDAEVAADPRTGRPACVSYDLITRSTDGDER
jgi:iron complex transport system ATP-binding protein